MDKLETVDLGDNPVGSLALTRLYIAHRLPRLQSLDGGDVTEEERERGRRAFGPADDALDAAAMATFR